MRTSQDSILTTYVGSLPRSEPLMRMLLDKEQGNALDESSFESQVRDDLQKQREVGIDIPNDGELPRLGFSFYVKDRMTGFGGHARRGTMTDFAKFPGYVTLKTGRLTGEEIKQSATMYDMPECQSAVLYEVGGDHEQRERDYRRRRL